MNWITKLAPKIKSILGGKKSLEVAENSWVKCSQCQTMLYSDDLEKNIIFVQTVIYTSTFIHALE